jgi:FKBP-type peptidyl-prolyl cis-trans isomerase
MKKLFILVPAIMTGLIIQAQKTPVKTTTAKVPPSAPLKTLADSASYAIGLSVVNFYKQQGVTSLNTTMISKAINDVMSGKKALFDDNTANAVMNNYMNKLQSQKSKPNIDAGEAFLNTNKSRPGVKTTATGLQYEVITEGTGPKPGPVDTIVCHYRGTLLNGTPFDNSYDRGQPLTIAANRVIPGWTEGLQLMSVGSKYIFYIPYTLGYGASDYGPIPGGSMLKFEVELLDVKKVKQ